MGTYCMTGSHEVSVPDTGFFRKNGCTKDPVLVQWMATLKCSLACCHCLSWSGTGSYEEMSLETVQDLLYQVSKMAVREFLLTGGEPLEREDLPEVICSMGQLDIPWSLNTARMPSCIQRKAIEKNPPGFVAVSLDGPSEIHDSFRGSDGAFQEAMDSIKYFKSLGCVEVCAGTTVTRYNYTRLNETFQIVQSSGADRWGIHMLVPEGRAALRSDLFLSRNQLRRLIRFVARKRRIFDVEMADEIGYLGDYEPLVRDRPLSCGAGRSQCVILPGGDVVPCTTLDIRYSAGNIREKSLREIWDSGFSQLRHWRPEGKCSGCRYSPACRGGCWLQRKAGTECFRDVWQMPDVMKTTAGIVICLGLSAVSTVTASDFLEEDPVPVTNEESLQEIELLESVIRELYVNRFRYSQTREEDYYLAELDSSDPGFVFFRLFARGELPDEYSGRCQAVSDALRTEVHSLSLVSLMWRALFEPVLDGDVSFDKLDYSDRMLVVDLVRELWNRARSWRPEFLRDSLIPFITRFDTEFPPFFLRSKAGPRPGQIEEYTLSRDLVMERLPELTGRDSVEITEEYLDRHPFAEQMTLIFDSGREQVEVLTPSENLDWTCGEDGFRVTVYDLLRITDDTELTLSVVCSLGIDNYWNDYDFRSGENIGNDPEISMEFRVRLDGGHEYTYAGLLREIYIQNRQSILTLCLDLLGAREVYEAGEERMYSITEIQSNETVIWPAVREILNTDIDLLVRKNAPDIYPDELRHSALLRDSDFWMF